MAPAHNNDDIHIDGETSKKQKAKNKTYLRQRLRKANRYAKNISFENSQEVILIQLADLIVGSARRMLLSDKSSDAKYAHTIQPHIQGIYLVP